MTRRRSSASPPFADLVGRADSLAQITRHFDAGARWITLLGPPGIGKTRLAAAYLAEARAGDREVAWIDLSTTTGRDALCARVAHEMGLRPSWIDRPDLVDEVGWALDGHGPVCVILDEGEHAGAVLAEVLSRWLGLAPEARVLVTSRERFGVPGEVPIELPPLGVDDATALLAARAGVEKTPAVAALAARLDGIPLALELVAPRLHLLAPEDLLARLDGGLDGLETERAGLAEALEASFARLDDPTRRALACCAIFEGGFRIDAAEAVIGGDALSLLQALRDKSLLARDGARARLYAPVRDFVRARLAAEDASEARARHAAFFAELARHADAPLVRDADDLRRALEVASPEDHGALAAALAEVALTLGPPQEALAVLEGLTDVDELRGRALEMLGRTDEAIAAYRTAAGPGALGRLAHAELARGAIDAASEAVERAVTEAPPRTATHVEALRVRGIVEHARGRLDAAFTAYDAARALAEELGQAERAARLRADIATVRLQQRRFAEAEAEYAAAIDGLDEARDPIALAVAEGNLAILEQERGELDAAAARLAKAFERARRVGHRLYAAHLGAYAGAVEHERGDLDAAIARYREALDGLRRVGDKRTLAVCASFLGAAEAGRNRIEAAEDAFAEAEAALASVDDPGVVQAARVHRAQLALARARASGDPEAGRAEAVGVLDAFADDATLRTSDDLRLALRLLRKGLGHGAVVVDESTQQITLPDGERIDLGARQVLWRIFAALLAARRERPPRPLDVHALLRAGWPGESPTGASGLNRVKVSLSTLRKLGLRSLLLRVEEGYLLDPDVPLR